MSISALEIKQRTFSKTLRGYDPAEVDAFLSMIANEWEHNVAKLKDAERDLREMKDKLAHYQRIEATLHETLQTARDNATQRLENARRDAANKIEKAELEAEGILKEARQHRQAIKQSISNLLERREEIIRGISSYLEMAEKSLSGFEQDENGIFKLPTDTNEEESVEEVKPTRKQPVTSVPGAEDIDDILDSID